MPATETRPTPPAARPARSAPVRSTPPVRTAVDDPEDTTTHWGLSLLLWGLMLVSAANFVRVYNAESWAAPILLSTLTALVLSLVARRARLHPLLSILVVLVGILLVSVWTTVAASTWHGLPLTKTWLTIGTALQQAQALFPRAVTPTPPATGFVVLSAWGTGLMAALADWSSFRLRSALHGAAPAFAVFLVCSVLGTAQYRLPAVTLEIVGVAVFVLAHRATVGTASSAWFRRDDGLPAGSGVTRWAASVGAGVLAVTVAISVAAVGVFAGPDGVGILGWKHPDGLGGTPTRVTPSPLVDLRPRLLDNPNVEVFTVRSPVASYWRLTSLNYFNGQVWSSNDSYNTVGGKLPGISKPPPGTRRVVETFDIQTLDSIWLPAGFDPEEVLGVPGASYDPRSGSLITPQDTTNGMNYRVVSLQVLSQLDPAKLNRAAPVRPSAFASDLQLPPLPPAVVTLARHIVAGSKTEYQKAVALQNFFHQPEFHYSLKVTGGSSTDALETFLFHTHIGYCQQYAGAYAVLARLIGLPTRVAVGFTSGQLTAGGYYQVTDADAHAWPEVYFTGIGWVPFQPTPGYVIPNAERYTGQVSPTPGVSTTPTTVAPATGSTPTTPSTVHQRSSHPRQLPPQSQSVEAGRHAAHHVPAIIVVGIALAALCLLAAGWCGLVATRRRYRRWRHRARVVEPDRRVLAAWAEACEALGWWRLRRRSDLTYTEFTRLADERMDELFGRYRLEDACTRGSLDRLANVATAAEYAPEQVRPSDAEWALSCADRLQRQLWAAAPWRQRLRRRFDPRNPATTLASGTGGEVGGGYRPTGRLPDRSSTTG